VDWQLWRDREVLLELGISFVHFISLHGVSSCHGVLGNKKCMAPLFRFSVPLTEIDEVKIRQKKPESG